ncbi:MAG TPA: DUF169 domain-containing protein [bacterium]|nr:DUF169 domain-containing protein [bacterium]
MEVKKWQEWNEILVGTLKMDNNPVALSCLNEPCPPGQPRQRLCRSLLEAARGQKVWLSAANNACFGAAWHLGFLQMDDEKTFSLIKKFVVEGEKLFASYQALENLISQMGEVPDNRNRCFRLSPLNQVDFQPQLIIFVVNPEIACRLLTLIVFPDGRMPAIKIGGPTCRMTVTYPLVSRQVNVSFYDYTARKMCGVEKDKLLVSVPAEYFPAIIENINRCSAGKARVEFPQEFREFLQKRMTSSC